MTDPNPTPLSEASPMSLVELFALDPLKLTRTDRDAIVAEFRRIRAVWAQAEALGKRPPKGGAVKGSAPSLSLDDLLK